MIKALNGKVLVEPVLHSDIRSEDAEKRSGLFIPKPANKLLDFEGIPNVGMVRYLPKSYDGLVQVGDRVVFKEERPVGIKYEGEKLFCLDLDQVIAIIGS